MRVRSALALVVLLLAVTASRPAAARSPDPKVAADQLYREGVALMEQNAFGEALGRFDRALSMFRHPKILAARGSALASLKRPLDAAVAFEQALGTEDIKPELADFVRGELAAVDKGLTQLTVEVTPSGVEAQVTIDGGAAMAAPVIGLRLLPGGHTVRASAGGHRPAEQLIQTRPGTRTVTLKLVPVKVPSPELSGDGVGVTAPPDDDTDPGVAPRPSSAPGGSRDRSRPIYKRWYFWAGIGAVVAGGVAVALVTRDPGVDHVAAPAGVPVYDLSFP